MRKERPETNSENESARELKRDIWATIRKLLVSRRQEVGLSRPKAAELTGVSPSYIWKLEKGDITNPTLETLFKLVTVYGIRVSEAVQGAEELQEPWVESEIQKRTGDFLEEDREEWRKLDFEEKANYLRYILEHPELLQTAEKIKELERVLPEEYRMDWRPLDPESRTKYLEFLESLAKRVKKREE